jgi:hypothetical protein
VRKIEHAVRTQRNRHNPQRRPEAEYGCRKEESSHQRLQNQRTGRCPHDGKQAVAEAITIVTVG